MKGQGLLAVMLIAALVFAGTATAYEASVFSTKRPDFEDKFGVELSGGFSMFELTDTNDYFLLTQGYNTVDEGQFGFGGGLALLYRSNEHFRWSIGYAFLGQESATGEYFSADDGVFYADEGTATGSEFYVAGNYLVPITDHLDLFVGAGVGVVSGNYDLVINNDSPSQGTSRYDAKGRGLSTRLQLGGEFRVTEYLGVSLTGGYRFANVPEIRYEQRNSGDADTEPTETIIYWGSGNRKLTVDFSGAFAELGVRLYFDPATNWFKQ